MQTKMSQELIKPSTTDELARERNRAAADRTLMAWIRTSIAMIGFGFGIGKITDTMEKANASTYADPIHSAQIFGEALITLGVVSLLAAVVQYWRIVKRIDSEQFVYTQSRALPMMTAISLLLIGLFGFIGILL
jgi:putative membrane protein